MARETLTMVGMIVGSQFGPVGAAVGSMIGNAIGSAIDPLTFQGPTLSDAVVQTSRDGVPIPIGYGITHLLGNIIQINPMVIVKVKEGDKKSGITESDRQTRTFAIGIGRGMDGPIGGIRRVWENNKLIYDVRDGSTFPEADNIAFAESTSIYLGDEHQLPDSELEIHTGVDTPAYRGLAYIVFINKDITNFGGSIPSYRFEISSCPVYNLLDRASYWWEFEEPSGSSATRLVDEVQAAEFEPQNSYTSVTGVDGNAATVDSLTSQNMVSGFTVTDQLMIHDEVWSCTFWFKTNSDLTGLENTYIVACWKHNSPLSGQRKWRFTHNSSANGFVFSIGQGPATTTFTDIDTGDISLATSTWYHLAATYDPAADEMSFTVSKRGDSVGTRQTATLVGGAYIGIPPAAAAITLGRAEAGALQTKGVIDMLAFWDNSAILTENEVSGLFTSERSYSGLQSESSPDTTGSVSWESIFGVPFSLGTFFGNFTFLVPEEGVSIRFTIPATGTAYKVDFTSLETASNPTRRFGAVNQTVLNFSSGATHTWGLGGGIDCGVNDSNQDIELTPGNTYFFNFRTEDYQAGSNWATLQASSLEIT